MRIILYAILAIAFLLVTFFGLGPVLIADGVLAERLATLAVVLFLYALIVFLWNKVKNR